MRDAGLTATELGPDGFPPTDNRVGRTARRLRPVLRRRVRVPWCCSATTTGRGPRRSGLESLVRRRGWWCWPQPPAPTATMNVPNWTKTSGKPCFNRPDWRRSRPWIARRAASARRHHGGDPPRDRVLAGSRIPLCLDTGHLLIGRHRSAGASPAGARPRAVAHLKDVDAPGHQGAVR